MAIVANPTQFGPKRILTGDEPFSPVDFSLLTKDELHQIYFALLEARIGLSGNGDIKTIEDVATLVNTSDGTVPLAKELVVGVKNEVRTRT